MDLTTVEYEKRGAIAYVTLNRPEKLNAMNETRHHELGRVWEDVRDDSSVRFAILSGKGRCFSAGADLSGGASKTRYRYGGDFPDITRTRGVYKPIVAALHSHVVGYGICCATVPRPRSRSKHPSTCAPRDRYLGTNTIRPPNATTSKRINSKPVDA
jgi:enoyl-CoA hydratase/carnithine racemase